MKVVLIPCGATEWHEEDRLLGRVELPLTSAGRERCLQWVAQLHPLGLRRILHAPDELTTQTAALLARQLAVPTKALEALAEVDLGLWTGLTEAQLKTRFASAHRELREAPLNVNPPGGESLRAAAERLCTCIRKQFRRNATSALGVVVRPFGFALAKSGLEGSELGDLWDAARNATEPIVIDCAAGTRPPATP